MQLTLKCEEIFLKQESTKILLIKKSDIQPGNNIISLDYSIELTMKPENNISFHPGNNYKIVFEEL